MIALDLQWAERLLIIECGGTCWSVYFDIFVHELAVVEYFDEPGIFCLRATGIKARRADSVFASRRPKSTKIQAKFKEPCTSGPVFLKRSVLM